MPVTRPINGLAIDPLSGGPIQQSCFGEENDLVLFSSDATNILTTPTLVNDIFNDGLIDVSGISVLGLNIIVILGTLTSADLMLRYTDLDNIVEAKDTYFGSTTSGSTNVYNVYEKKIRFITNGQYMVSLPVANAKYLKLYRQGNGTNSSSLMFIYIGRGWGTGFHLVT